MIIYPRDVDKFKQLVNKTISSGIPSSMTTTIYYRGEMQDIRIRVERCGPDGAVIQTRQIDDFSPII